MTDNTLVVENLSVRFGAAVVLRGAGVQVLQGRIAGLIGVNGAGKTTLLRAISGQVRRAEGRLTLGGRSLPSRPEAVAAFGVSHVPEGRRLFGGLTVRENLLVAGRGRRRERLARADELIGTFPQLESKMATKAAHLSGGEQQLVALARGLMPEPKVLLVDEMSLGLSPVALEHAVSVLRDVSHQQDLGVLLVDQNAEVIGKYCDSTYALKDATTSLVDSSLGAASLWQ